MAAAKEKSADVAENVKNTAEKVTKKDLDGDGKVGE